MFSKPIIAVLWLPFFNSVSALDVYPSPAELKPKLNEMLNFSKSNGEFIDLSSIIVDYKAFANCILGDNLGFKLRVIESKEPKVKDIVQEVLIQWNIGKGKFPYDWKGFIDCLLIGGYYELGKEFSNELGMW